MPGPPRISTTAVLTGDRRPGAARVFLGPPTQDGGNGAVLAAGRPFKRLHEHMHHLPIRASSTHACLSNRGSAGSLAPLVLCENYAVRTASYRLGSRPSTKSLRSSLLPAATSAFVVAGGADLHEPSSWCVQLVAARDRHVGRARAAPHESPRSSPLAGHHEHLRGGPQGLPARTALVVRAAGRCTY